MKNMHVINIVFILFTALSCSKTEPIEVTHINTDTNADNYLWQIPLLPDTFDCTSIVPIVYKDFVLVSAYKWYSTENTQLNMYNINDGTFQWHWNNAIEDGGDILSSTTSTSYKFQNYYAQTAGGDVMLINLINGETLWSTKIYYALSQISGFNDMIFQCRTSSNIDYESVNIMSSVVYTEAWDTVLTFHKTDGFAPTIPTVTGSINDSGDTIIYFQNRQYNFSEYEGKIDFYAYNMSADSVLWVKYNIDPQGNSNLRAPIVYHNKVYFEGFRTLFCFDAETGETIWSTFFWGSLETIILSNMVIGENKLIVKTDGKSIYAFNLETGGQLWVNDNAGDSCSDMVFYNGTVYYSSGADGMIHAIDATLGYQNWTLKSPNDWGGGSFTKPVTLDPNTNCLFATDGYFLICYRLEDL